MDGLDTSREEEGREWDEEEAEGGDGDIDMYIQ